MNFLAADTTPYWRLDSVIGWQSAQQNDVVEFGTEGNLRLQSLPGEAVLYQGGSPGGMGCPVAAGLDECGVLFVLDAAQDRLWRVRTDTGEARMVRELGGRGHDARRFATPRGFTLLPGGGAAICDTNNHRVQVFSASPYALIELWGAAGNEPGSGPLEFRWPWGIAYGPDGFLYIADRGNARIQRVRPDGTGWSELGVGVLSSPLEVAVSATGYVAVTDATPTGSRVVVFAPGTWTSQILGVGYNPLSVAFDPAGNLYAGTAKGLVFQWTSNFQPAGAGVTGLDGAIQSLTWFGNNTLLATINEQDVTPLPRRWSIPTAGAFVASGVFCGLPLDSGIENCAWHRIEVEGNVPAGTSLRIETVTTPDTKAPQAEWQTAVLSPPPVPVAELKALLGTSTIAQTPSGTYQNPDGLVQSGLGRYLRLRITMISSGSSSPEIHAINVYFPRQSYLRYLPANFQDDDQSRLFLDRFLSVFQTSFDAFDRRIDDMWRLFDPLSTPKDWYNWLAA